MSVSRTALNVNCNITGIHIKSNHIMAAPLRIFNIVCFPVPVVRITISILLVEFTASDRQPGDHDKYF